MISDQPLCPEAIAGCVRTPCGFGLLLALLALPTPAAAQFGYMTNAGGSSITITSYAGPGGAVSIPTNINGLTVSSIGPYAFEDRNGLTSVTIPGSVTSIGAGAFLGCAGLAGLTIPGSVANVGDYAFDLCTSLASVMNGDGVASIGDYAFNSCTSLASVTIPGSVTNIGQAPFDGCSLLTAITVDSGNRFYSSVGGVLFDQSHTTLIEYPAGQGRSYTIPLGVTSIGGAAFAGSSLTNATIPGSVTNIGAAPFNACSLLTAITVDSGNRFYSSVGGVLFDKSLTTLVEYPEGKAGTYTIPLGVTGIESNAFSECLNLTNVTMPESVTSIGESAFAGSGLTGVTLGSNLTNIGPYAFESCPGLTSVTIPNRVTSIGKGAFIACPSLSGVTIPNSVTSLGSGVFDACYGLTYLTIGNGVTNLENAVFAFCSSLAGVYFEGDAPGVSLSAFRNDNATVYYLPGAMGWGTTFDTLPTVLWNSQVQPGSFGVRTNQFGFTITGSSNLVVVVQVTASLSNPVWSPLATNTLNGNPLYFSDPQWTNYPSRFYRVTWP